MGTALSIAGYLFIALAVILSILTLRRVIKKEKSTARDRAVPIILLGVGFLYVIALAFHFSGEIQLSDRIQILLMFGLVAVTSFYAWSASRQADASVKMADGMARPIIDIQGNIEKGEKGVQREGLEANAALSADTSCGLSCILHNVGLGPAIDVFSFIEHPERGRLRWDFGTIATDRKTERMILSFRHPDNRMALVAYYKDVYDNWFESSREVTFNKEKTGYEIGPLKIRAVIEDELTCLKKPLNR